MLKSFISICIASLNLLLLGIEVPIKFFILLSLSEMWKGQLIWTSLKIPNFFFIALFVGACFVRRNRKYTELLSLFHAISLTFFFDKKDAFLIGSICYICDTSGSIIEKYFLPGLHRKKIAFFGAECKEIAEGLETKEIYHTNSELFIVNGHESLKNLVAQNLSLNVIDFESKEDMFFFKEKDLKNIHDNFKNDFNIYLKDKKVLIICNSMLIIQNCIELYEDSSLIFLTCNVEALTLNHPEIIYYKRGIALPSEFDFVIDLFDVDVYNYQLYRTLIQDLTIETTSYLFNHIKSCFIDTYVMNLYKKIILSALSKKKRWALHSVECGFVRGAKNFRMEFFKSIQENILIEDQCYFTSQYDLFCAISYSIQSALITNNISTKKNEARQISCENIIKFFNSKDISLKTTNFYIDSFEIYEDTMNGVLDSDYSIEEKIINKYFHTNSHTKNQVELL